MDTLKYRDIECLLWKQQKVIEKHHTLQLTSRNWYYIFEDLNFWEINSYYFLSCNKPEANCICESLWSKCRISNKDN